MESKVFTLDQTTIKKLLTIFRLVIPDFQRNFVWKKSKKEQLLDSLFRGFPIGAITLYVDEGVYYIIDGLQRINTLNQYLSCPSIVISFDKFYEKVEPDITKFLESREMTDILKRLKKCIKIWYEKLNGLYEFEKVSVLYGILKNENVKVANKFESLELVEGLLDILKAKIEIAHDDIALIIYRGDKNDLPDLFKNINTGSVALSQYEILQSVWNDYTLDRKYIAGTGDAFDRELDTIKNDYEISAAKETGKFDIFKNILGLNYMLCCKEDCGIVFHFPAFKEFDNPKTYEDGTVKYYKNDSIAFEIYSTILIHAPNKIVDAIGMLYKNTDYAQISIFVNEINKVIIEAVDIAIRELKNKKTDIRESKYHSLYIIAGIIFSRYDIDVKNLTVRNTEVNMEIYDMCMQVEQHIEDKWFVDENRQVTFFNIKIENLLEMKASNNVSKGNISGMLQLRVAGEIISERTVKDFYRSIFELLHYKGVDLKDKIPYATGKKRYLVNWTNRHIYGDPFVAPIPFDNYYIETHKSKSGATRDIYNFLKNIGVEVSYVN